MSSSTGRLTNGEKTVGVTEVPDVKSPTLRIWACRPLRPYIRNTNHSFRERNRLPSGICQCYRKKQAEKKMIIALIVTSQCQCLTLTLLSCHNTLLTSLILHWAIQNCYSDSNDNNNVCINEYGRSYPVICDQSCRKVKAEWLHIIVPSKNTHTHTASNRTCTVLQWYPGAAVVIVSTPDISDNIIVHPNRPLRHRQLISSQPLIRRVHPPPRIFCAKSLRCASVWREVAAAFTTRLSVWQITVQKQAEGRIQSDTSMHRFIRKQKFSSLNRIWTRVLCKYCLIFIQKRACGCLLTPLTILLDHYFQTLRR